MVHISKYDRESSESAPFNPIIVNYQKTGRCKDPSKLEQFLNGMRFDHSVSEKPGIVREEQLDKSVTLRKVAHLNGDRETLTANCPPGRTVPNRMGVRIPAVVIKRVELGVKLQICESPARIALDRTEPSI